MAVSGRHRAGSTEALLAAIVSGSSVAEAASAAGVSARTAARRLAEPATQTRLADLRAEALAAVADRLATAAADAVDLLALVVVDSTVIAGVRVRAASVLLAQSVALRDATLLERRIAQLEALAAAREASSARWAS